MQEMQENNIDKTGWILISILFLFLAYSGWLSYKAIDWDVLKRLEAIPLVLPTPLPTNTPATPSGLPTK